MPGLTKTTEIIPQRFDAPMLSAEDTVRMVSRHDALSQRRRFDAGFQEGRTEGFAQGAAEAEGAIADHRRSADRLGLLGNALEHAINDVQNSATAETETLERGIVDMAMQIAEAVIGREITDHEYVADNVRRSLQLCGREGPMDVKVHPDEVSCIEEATAAGLLTWPRGADLVADASVSRGGCVIDAGGARLDSQVEAAMDRIRAALLSN